MKKTRDDEFGQQLTQLKVQTPYQQQHNQHSTSYFDPSTLLEIFIANECLVIARPFVSHDPQETKKLGMNLATEQLTESQVQTPYQQQHNQHGTSYLDPRTFLEIVIGLHFDVVLFVIDCAITNVVTADQNIHDKVVRATKNKFHKFNIILFVAGSLRRRHLVC